MRSISSEGHSQHPDGRFRSTQGNALFAALHKHVRCVRTGTRDFKILELVVGFFLEKESKQEGLSFIWEPPSLGGGGGWRRRGTTKHRKS